MPISSSGLGRLALCVETAVRICLWVQNKSTKMKPITFETLIQDQKERLERRNLKQGDNSVLDFVNEINNTTFNLI